MTTPAEVPSDDASAEVPSAEDTTVIVTDNSGHTQVVTPTKDSGKTTAKPPVGGDTGMAAPKNAAEAMKMYNDALAKTSISGKVSKVDLVTATAGGDNVNYDLKTVHESVVPTFQSETKNKFNNKLFPISGATLNGTPSKSGNIITIKFNLAPFTDANATYGKNGFAYFVTANDAASTVGAIIKKIGGPAESLQIKIKSIDSINLTGTMTVKIDANTGKLVSATYSFKETVKGKAQAKIGPFPIPLGVNIVGSGTCEYTGK